jgi:hypothetical protein
MKVLSDPSKGFGLWSRPTGWRDPLRRLEEISMTSYLGSYADASTLADMAAAEEEGES